jgi:PAS domain S-box-containing protein
MTQNELHILREPPSGLDPRFYEAMNASPVMIWVSGEDKLCNWVNQSWMDFTGRSMAQELGNGWTEAVHPDDVEQFLAAYLGHFNAREKFRLSYRLRRHDGIYRWIDNVGIPRFGSDGRLLGYIGSCFDSHDQSEAEVELRRLKQVLEQQIGEASTQLQGEIEAHNQTEKDLLRSATQLALLIQGIKDCAIYLLTSEGRVSSWNSGAQRIKGYAAAEIIGRHFSCFYTEEDRAIGMPTTALHKAATEGKFEAEGWRVRKDGTRFWASVLIDPVYDSTGELVGYGKVTRDLSEKRLAQEQLERARESMQQMQKMEAIGQLTGGVAHDFNNLLMVIMGNLETVQRQAVAEKSSPERLQRALENAMQGARRAATLTQRLLAFSRRQPLAPRVLNLNKFIANEVEFLQRTLGEDIEVEAVGGAGVWKVQVDTNQLEAALLNLAVNARDAMPGGGKLTIETSNAYLDEDYCHVNPEVEPGQYVLLSVTDNGEGMTREILARVFEPFFSTKAVGHGTGLGLSQVYGFIKQSGGHVKLYSEPGEGTTVNIYLPRSIESGEDVGRERERSKPLPGDPSETILLVEDDPDVRSYLLDTLRDLNYHVLPAEDSDSAMAIIEQSSVAIDLLLTDVILPGMNGRELSRRARIVRPGLKVLFMTGYSRNAIVHQGRLDADVELMQKPVTQAQLASRIRTLLDARPGD